MSYILEALKKADAERERGAVPDLHAQPVLLAPHAPHEAPRSAKPWLWLGAGAVIVLVAVLAWRWGSSDGPPGAAPAVAAVPPAATTAASSAAVAAVPAALPAAVPAAMPAAPPAAPAAAALPLVAPDAAPRQVAAPQRTQPAPPRQPREPAATTAKPTSKTKPAPTPATRTPLLSELPEDTRRQVPAMTIGGSVYSPQPPSRMVIINGQVFREGSAVTPDLLLEQIGPKSAVFSLRGQRFEMPF